MLVGFNQDRGRRSDGRSRRPSSLPEDGGVDVVVEIEPGAEGLNDRDHAGLGALLVGDTTGPEDDLLHHLEDRLISEPTDSVGASWCGLAWSETEGTSG